MDGDSKQTYEKEDSPDGRLKKAADESEKLRIQFASATKQVRELNEFIQIMLNLSPFGICIFEKQKLIFTNKAFAEIVGFSPRELRGSHPEDMVFKDDLEHVQKSLRGMLDGESDSFCMFRVLTKDEKVKWILGSFALIHMNQQQAILGNFVDLTEGKVMQIAYSDPLTALPNRKLMMDRLEQAILSAKRREALLALLFIDLDGFKEINDTHGHDFGDKALIGIADRLRQVVRRENDTIARIGGDEFLILLTDVAEKKHIEVIVRHLFEKFKAPLAIGDPPVNIHVRFSVGISLFPEHGTDSNALMTSADQAMYRVKNTDGKNSFRFFKK
ncbi:MAG: sensor domain-containing diguanylate cyclase [Smithellaceae bacterium]